MASTRSRAAGTAVSIRPARLEEAAALTALTHRSKAHWGYDEAFMAAARAALAIEAGAIAEGRVWVAEDPRGRTLGVASLQPAGEGAWSLDTLFVEPSAIGRGAGEALFRHVAQVAKGLGAAALLIESDPNAAGFYERMGAVLAGDAASDAVPGLRLPLYRYAL
jgi:GNAT superfamily N-acetyltransferase